MLKRTFLGLAAALVLCAPALAQSAPGDPGAFIAELYAPADPNAPDATGEEPEEPSIYAAGLRALLQLDARRDMNYLDFDWVSGGQDLPEYKNLKIVVVKRTGDTAQVRVTFKNYGEARERLIDLVQEDGRWVIEDVYMKAPEKDWLSRRLIANPQD